MNNTKEKELDLINKQLIAIILFIITLIVSFVITYNEKLQKENKETLFSNKTAINIALINRIVVFILGAYFLYDAYQRKILAEKNQNSSISEITSNLQILSSWLALLSSLVILYIIILNYSNINFDISGTASDINDSNL